VQVEVSAELGRTGMRLGLVTSLEGGGVITLDETVDDPVTVYVNGALYATARLVEVDGNYGIEILEVLEPERV
jgi:flagellar motor switch protein FliN